MIILECQQSSLARPPVTVNPWRYLLDKWITDMKARKSCEVTVDCPELVDSVLNRKRCNMGIMDEIAGGMTTPYRPAKMRRVCRSLTKKDE
jgi:hypothetical protein